MRLTATDLRMVPASHPRRDRRAARRRLGPVVVGSALLHAAVLAAILWWLHRETPLDLSEEGGAQFSVEFAPTQQAAPASGPEQPDAPPGPAAPAPSVAPSPDAVTPAPQSRADVNLSPPPEPDAEEAEPTPPMPQPLPLPTPTPPVRPAPRPRPAPRSTSPFSSPMNFSLGGPPPPPQRSGSARGLSLAFSPGAIRPAGPPGGASTGNFDAQQISGPALGRDWFGQLSAWWRQHRYYPDQARNAGESGLVAIRMTVDPTGRVRAVEVQTGSGSMWLDSGALAVFRNAKLPPFPPGAENGDATIQLNINYILTRG